MKIDLTLDNPKRERFVGNVDINGHMNNEVRIHLEADSSELRISVQSARSLANALNCVCDHVEANKDLYKG